MQPLLKKFLIPTLITTAFVATPFIAQAGLLPACATGAGRCGFNDIVQTFVNFAKMILGFVGTAVLVYFVYGGFVWLTAAGDSTKISKGKEIIVNTVIGLIIVFGAYTIVQFVFRALGATPEAQIGQECAEGDQRGVYVPDVRNPTGPPRCVTSCSAPELSQSGYRCMDPSQGTNCIRGLCPGGETNVCCQSTQ